MTENEEKDIIAQLKEAKERADRIAKELEHNLHEAEQNNRLIKLLQMVAMAANESNTIEEAIQLSIDGICDFTGWEVGHCYVLDEKEERLVSTRSWHLSDLEKYKAFKTVSERFQPDAKSWVGNVFKGDPSFIANVQEADNFVRKDAAKSCGLKAAFAFPIFVESSVGVMEFFSSEVKEPDIDLLMLMVSIGKQLGQLVARKHAEEKARLMEALVANAHDGIIIAKAKHRETLETEIVYTNKAFDKLFGFSLEELLGKDPCSFLEETHNDENLKALRSALLNGESFEGEFHNYTKSGRSLWVDMSVVPVKNQHNQITHFAAMQRDVTDRKDYEHTLKAAKRLAESSNRAKSEFLANMSHEIRTPMNGIMGMSNLLLKTALNDEQKEYAEIIYNSSDTLLVLLNDILDISKIEAGELALEQIPFDITQSFLETVQLLTSISNKKALELKLSVDNKLPQYVIGDPARLKQVLTNLIGNALKFTEVGYVKVHVDLVEDKGKPYCYCEVKDTGTGIPEEKLQSIFRKFVQADASTSRKYGGTGLGLAITKQLVEMMGGTIGVHSSLGKGANFWFKIPITKAKPEDLAREAGLQEGVQSKHTRVPIASAKVLLVEDYPVNQKFALKLLSSFGIRHIDLAENGVEALNKAMDNHYDLIFMDCQMPQMDGYDTTREIRKHEKKSKKHVPIVATTANAMVGDKEKCIKCGMDDYISKPIKPERLQKILGDWLIFDKNVELDILKPIIPHFKEPDPVNRDHLAIFTDGDPDEEKALLDMFFEQTESLMGILKAHALGGAQEPWREASHKLKGSSGNLGADHLFSLCSAAEKFFDVSKADKEEILESIEEELVRIKRFLGRV